MKVLLLSVVVIFGGAFTQAATESPWGRICRNEQGQVSTLKAGSDELSVCFFGDAAIGAETLFLYKTKATNSTEALHAYKNRKTSSPRGGVCGAFDADLLQTKGANGENFNFCRFSDSSLIEETTLWLGPGSVSSESLDRALTKKN